jgi:hypothetical protein
MRNCPERHHYKIMHTKQIYYFSVTNVINFPRQLCKKIKQLILMTPKFVQMKCILYTGHNQKTAVYITSLHRLVQSSLPLKLPLCLKEFYLIFSHSSDLSNPAKLITYIVYRPPSWVRKPKHVVSMKTYIPSLVYRQTVLLTLDWFNRFIS